MSAIAKMMPNGCYKFGGRVMRPRRAILLAASQNYIKLRVVDQMGSLIRCIDLLSSR